MQQQMSLAFEPGLSVRFRSLVDCVASGVYGRGLGRVAPMLDTAPSHLSVQLADDGTRHLPAATVERYIEATGDLTPIYYLLDKFCRDPAARQQEAVAQLAALVPQLAGLMEAAGLTKAARPVRSR